MAVKSLPPPNTAAKEIIRFSNVIQNILQNELVILAVRERLFFVEIHAKNYKLFFQAYTNKIGSSVGLNQGQFETMAFALVSLHKIPELISKLARQLKLIKKGHTFHIGTTPERQNSYESGCEAGASCCTRQDT